MPKPKRLLKVFCCHASEDEPRVRELAQRLSAEGWIDPWLDEKKLLPGQDRRLKIEEAVETSDIVILCLSNNSVSKEGVVQKELRIAKDISLEKPEGSIFLIPLRIDACDVPRDLRSKESRDYFGEKKDETYNALLKSLKLGYEQTLEIEKKDRARRKEEKREQEAAENVAREQAKRDFDESEKAEHRAARRVELDKFISRFFAALKSNLTKSATPVFGITAIVGVVIILFLGVSWALQLLSPIPTASRSATTPSSMTESETPALTFTNPAPTLTITATNTSAPLTPQSTLPPPVITMPKDGALVTWQIDVFGSDAQSALEPGTYLYVIVIPPSVGPPTYYVQEIPTIEADGTWRSGPVHIGEIGPSGKGKTFQICAVLHNQQLQPGEISSFPTGSKSCIKVVR